MTAAIAQGMPECSVCTCMLVCVFFAHFCTRERESASTPAFPVPLISRVRFKQTSELCIARTRGHICITTIPILRRPGQASQRARPSAGPMTGSASAIRDPYAAADVVFRDGRRLSFNNWRRWLWVPAFAGTAVDRSHLLRGRGRYISLALESLQTNA